MDELPRTNMLSIGKIAAIYHLSVQTLRYYDKIGLFVPSIVGEASGYRYYDVARLKRLEFVLFLRDLQLPLNRVRELADRLENACYSQESLEEVLKSCIRQLEEQRRQLDEHLATVRRCLEVGTGRKPPLMQIELREYPERWFYSSPSGDLAVQRPGFPQKLLQLRGSLLNRFDISSDRAAFGAICSKDALLRQDEVRYERMLLSTERDPRAGQSVPLPGGIRIPAGKFASVLYERDHEHPTTAHRALLDFCAAHRFPVTGDLLELEMDPLFASLSQLSSLMELQAPIEY